MWAPLQGDWSLPAQHIYGWFDVATVAPRFMGTHLVGSKGLSEHSTTSGLCSWLLSPATPSMTSVTTRKAHPSSTSRRSRSIRFMRSRVGICSRRTSAGFSTTVGRGCPFTTNFGGRGQPNHICAPLHGRGLSTTGVVVGVRSCLPRAATATAGGPGDCYLRAKSPRPPCGAWFHAIPRRGSDRAARGKRTACPGGGTTRFRRTSRNATQSAGVIRRSTHPLVQCARGVGNRPRRRRWFGLAAG